MTLDKPIIAVTIGDPAGVGPEIVAKALTDPSVHEACVPFAIGDIGLLERALETAADVECRCQLSELGSIEELGPSSGTIQVLQTGRIELADYAPGTVRAEYGKAAGLYIGKAVELALAGQIHGIATAPIQKESFKAAGWPYPGHTEMLADLTSTRDFALMLALDNFRVVHVSQHVSLAEAVKLVTRKRVLQTIRIAHFGCQTLGITRPRIGVAGLNPHAGENGLFGNEEKIAIGPAIDDARKEDIDAEGPFSPDTVFSLLRGGKFDVVVAMTHDQGGIPMKLLSFDWDSANHRWSRIRGVNISLGLPIVRTSVSHGTGFEIAGSGVADPTSLREAILLAAKIARIKFAARFPKP